METVVSASHQVALMLSRTPNYYSSKARSDPSLLFLIFIHDFPFSIASLHCHMISLSLVFKAFYSLVLANHSKLLSLLPFPVLLLQPTLTKYLLFSETHPVFSCCLSRMPIPQKIVECFLCVRPYSRQQQVRQTKSLPSSSSWPSGEDRQGKNKPGSICQFVNGQCYKDMESRAGEMDSEEERAILEWSTMFL